MPSSVFYLETVLSGPPGHRRRPGRPPRRQPHFSPFPTPHTACLPPFAEIQHGGDRQHPSDATDTARPAPNLPVEPWQGSKDSGPEKRFIKEEPFFFGLDLPCRGLFTFDKKNRIVKGKLSGIEFMDSYNHNELTLKDLMTKTNIGNYKIFHDNFGGRERLFLKIIK